MPVIPHREVLAFFARDQRKMRRKFGGTLFADFRLSIPKEYGRKKIHKNSTTCSTVHQIKFFHCSNSGSWEAQNVFGPNGSSGKPHQRKWGYELSGKESGTGSGTPFARKYKTLGASNWQVIRVQNYCVFPGWLPKFVTYITLIPVIPFDARFCLLIPINSC